jgi:hypothetical protein
MHFVSWNSRIGLSWLLVVGCLALVPAQVQADSITYTGNKTGSSGTGFGSIDNILGLHNNTTESGGVSWNGGPKDVTTGDATNQSQTLTADHLLNVTKISWTPGSAADFVVIFQVNQEGSTTLDLHSFQLDFFTDAGGSAIPSVKYTDSGNPSSAALGGVGVGTSGYVFNVHLDAADAQTFFGTLTNRLGLSVSSGDPITGSNDGPENWYVAATQSAPVITPAPSALVLAIVGIATSGVPFVRRFRKSKKTT